MKIFKKSLAVLMASMMVLSSGALAASAADTGTGTGGFIMKSLVTDGMSMHLEGQENSVSFETESDDVEDSGLPDSFDLRDEGRLTPASSQYMGDCWSYAAIASLESNAISQGYGKNYFSRSHLVSFALNPADEGFNVDDVWDYGGNAFYASLTLANLEGIASRKSFPDNKDDGTFTISESDRYNHDSGFVLDDTVYMNDTQDIKEYIMENGAVYADYYSIPGSDCVYSEKYGASMIYNPGSETTNHAIAIVGWDDTIPASEFTVNGKTPNVNGGWLIRNSWTDDDIGSYYMYISYAQNIQNVAGFSVREDTDTYNNYTYAPRGGENSIGGEHYLAFGNVYTAEGDESINEVGFYLLTENTDSDTSVKVSIYKNLPDSDGLNAGTPALTFTDTVHDYGFFTLSLPKSVSISKGEKFGVTIELNNSDGKVYTITELNGRKLFKGFEGTYKGAEGQSFAKTEEDENYSDLYKEFSYLGICDIYTQVYTSCNHNVTKNSDGLTNNCSQCGKALTICETHTEGYTRTTKEASYTDDGEIDTCCTKCGEIIGTETIPKLTVPSVKIRNNPGTKTIKYGEQLKLYADIENGNDNCYIRWSDTTDSNTLLSSIVYFSVNKNCTITAELVDKDGNSILDADGNPVKDSENIKVNSNIFLIIITFFKDLFGLGRTVVEN